MAVRIKYLDVGLKDYGDTWNLQEQLFQKVLGEKQTAVPPQERTNNVLLLCEHPHVYTLGKSGQEKNLLIPEEKLKKIGADFYRINRGGDITYHGPGQLVGYPIIDLELLGISIRSYIDLMETSIIRTLNRYAIEAGRKEGATGVWTRSGEGPEAQKICAIGVRVSHYVTMHGFALNVNTDLEYFSHIHPCGFQDKGVTSMQKILNRTLDMKEVKEIYKDEFANTFKVNWLKQTV